MEKELKEVTKNSGFIFGGRILSLTFGFVFSFSVARLMGPQIYGRFMYLYTFVVMLSNISNLGLKQGLISFIPKLNVKNKLKKRNSIISFTLVFTTLISVFLVFLININSKFIAINILNDFTLNNLIIFISPLLIFEGLLKINNGIFRGIKNIKPYILGKNILFSILKLLLVIIFSILGYKIFGVIYSYYISLILVSFYFIFKLYNLNLIGGLKRKYLSNYWNIIKFSLPLLFAGILSVLINKTDTLMIGYLLTDADVGIYNIALKIARLSSFSLIAFNNMFAPIISSLYHENKISKLADMYKVITKWVVTFNLIAFSLVFIFRTEIMRIFGPEFIMGSKTLVLISLGQLVNAGVGAAGYINIMTGNQQYNLYTNIISLILNITLNYTLIPIMGIEGAAIASFVSIGITNLMRLFFVYKEHKIHPYSKKYVSMIFSVTTSFVIIYILNHIIDIFWLIRLFGLSMFFVLLFIIIYYLFSTTEEDKIIINSVFKKLNIKYRI